MSTQKQEYFASLEGIRGYAFLAVFFLHYNAAWTRPLHLSGYPGFILLNLTWFLVPIFFVLSGFLITRTLVATRERQGFFRTFYFRRAIRVLPLYYATALVVLAIGLFLHWDLQAKHLLYFVYLQNFTVHPPNYNLGANHLWSLAIEEQFYLIWPLVIWAFRSDRSLLRVSYGFVAACMVIRIGWPLLHVTGSHAYFLSHAYYLTFNRIDGIVLGGILAIHYKRATNWDALVKYSKMFIPLGIALMAAVLAVTGSTWPDTPGRIAVCIPVMNFLGLAFVVLALTPATRIAKICSGSRICSFGRLTYGLYLFHFLYLPWFLKQVPVLGRHMPAVLASSLVNAAALALTFLLATFAYKFIEVPALRFKDRVKYGPAVVRPSSTAVRPWQHWVREPSAIHWRSLLGSRREHVA